MHTDDSANQNSRHDRRVPSKMKINEQSEEKKHIPTSKMQSKDRKRRKEEKERDKNTLNLPQRRLPNPQETQYKCGKERNNQE